MDGPWALLAETVGRSKALVEEVKAADVVVVGSPMYNVTAPSTLKAWIDHVSIAVDGLMKATIGRGRGWSGRRWSAGERT